MVMKRPILKVKKYAKEVKKSRQLRVGFESSDFFLYIEMHFVFGRKK